MPFGGQNYIFFLYFVAFFTQLLTQKGFSRFFFAYFAPLFIFFRPIDSFYMDYFLVFIIIFAAVFIGSSFGFGDAMVAMPLLTLFLGLAICAPLVNLVACVSSFIVCSQSWREARLSAVIHLLIAALVAAPLGVYLPFLISEQVLKIILAIFILSFAIYNLLFAHYPLPKLKNILWAYLFGILSGLFGGAYNISGPPVVIYGLFQQWSAVAFRASLQLFFLILSVIIFITRLWQNVYPEELFNYFLICLPAIFTAVGLGNLLNKKIAKPEVFKPLLNSLLILLSIALLL